MILPIGTNYGSLSQLKSMSGIYLNQKLVAVNSLGELDCFHVQLHALRS